MVLRQDVYIANSKLRFERLSDGIANQIGLEFFPNQLEIKLSNRPKGESKRHADFADQPIAADSTESTPRQ